MLARVRLQTATVADLGTREFLQVIAPDAPNRGWSNSAQVRSDSLELFFQGTWPRGTAWSVGLLASHRAGAGDPWSGAERILSLADPKADVSSTTSQARYQESSPLLLPDWKTLLFFSEFEQFVQVAQRDTTKVTDLAFGPFHAAGLDEGGAISSLTLSCDRRHILYAWHDRADDTHWEARSVGIRSLDPPAFSAPEAMRTSAQPPIDLTFRQTLLMAEALDCKTLYLADDFDLYVADRVACP
jgi:hypothetical protein